MEGQTQKLGVFEAYSRGWKAFASNWKLLVGLYLILFISGMLFEAYGYQEGESYTVPAEVAAQYDAGDITETDLATAELLYLFQNIDSVEPSSPEDEVTITTSDQGNIGISALGGLFSYIMGVVMIAVALLVGRGRKVSMASVRELVTGYTLVSYLFGTILVGLAVIVGLVLLIVPGIIFALMFSMTTYAIVDKHMGPIEAMKHSKVITKGNRLKILGIVLLMILLMILAVIPAGLGILIVGPWAAQTLVAMYLHLIGETQSPVMETVPPMGEDSSDTNTETEDVAMGESDRL